MLLMTAKTKQIHHDKVIVRFFVMNCNITKTNRGLYEKVKWPRFTGNYISSRSNRDC